MKPTYVFNKERKTFGRQCRFSERHEVTLSIPSDRDFFKANFVLQNPVDKSTNIAPIVAASECNTVGKQRVHRGMLHNEGGWPKDVNYLDDEISVRYKRKIEKEDNYAKQVGLATLKLEYLLRQNNAVNIYEQYFEGLEGIPPPVESKIEQIQLFKDPAEPKRPIRHISWSADEGARIATAHSDLGENPAASLNSYIWDVENPNVPLSILSPPTQMLCLEFSPRNLPILCSGLLSGQVAIFDFRSPNVPSAVSIKDDSHQAACNSIQWINSQSGQEFFSGGADGSVLWWDCRDLTKPMERLLMDPVKTDDQDIRRAYGVTVLEYETTIPAKFMVGTKQGMLFSCNRRGKTPIEKIHYKLNCHFGPVLSVGRNPSYVKTFLTVGDWNARLWSEDNRDSAIFWTKNHKAALTHSAWSFGRCSLFFISRADGTVDAWDILVQQDKPILSLKICDARIECLQMRADSQVLAAGDENGKMHLIRVSDDLTRSAKKDKALLVALMDRESQREKILSDKRREWNLKQRNERAAVKPTEEEEKETAANLEEELQNNIKAAEKEFMETVQKELEEQRKAFVVTEESEEEEEAAESEKERSIETVQEVDDAEVEEKETGNTQAMEKVDSDADANQVETDDEEQNEDEAEGEE